MGVLSNSYIKIANTSGHRIRDAQASLDLCSSAFVCCPLLMNRNFVDKCFDLRRRYKTQPKMLEHRLSSSASITWVQKQINSGAIFSSLPLNMCAQKKWRQVGQRAANSIGYALAIEGMVQLELSEFQHDLPTPCHEQKEIAAGPMCWNRGTSLVQRLNSINPSPEGILQRVHRCQDS